MHFSYCNQSADDINRIINLTCFGSKYIENLIRTTQVKAATSLTTRSAMKPSAKILIRLCIRTLRDLTLLSHMPQLQRDYVSVLYLVV